MDEVDLWLIQSLLEAKTGSSGRPYVPGQDSNIFLDYVIQTVPTVSVPQDRKFNVFLVEQGVPDLFTLTGFSQPVICYHTGYVGKFTKFRNYIMEDPDKPRIDNEGIANLFELVSALYLQAGNCSFATTCLLQSIIQSPPSPITDKEEYDIDNYELHSSFHHRRSLEVAVFTLLYYGFTHEIGHTYADDCLRTGAKVHSREITDEAIAQAVAECAKNTFKRRPDAHYLFEDWQESYVVNSKDKGSILHCDNLRSEILADNLGSNILITAISSLSRYCNQKPNLQIIASEIIIGLFVVQLMEACKYLVKALPVEQLNPKLISRYVPSIEDILGIETQQSELASLYAEMNAGQMIEDFQIAHQVRWEFLKPSLASLAMLHLFPDTWRIQGNSMVPTCSPPEIARRQAIAVNTVDRYLSGYTKEMMKFQARLADVVNFVSHMVIDKVPEHRARKSVNETFTEHIAANFQTYLDLLKGREGTERKQEILAQLIEHKTLLQRRSKECDLQPTEKFINRLKAELNNR